MGSEAYVYFDVDASTRGDALREVAADDAPIQTGREVTDRVDGATAAHCRPGPRAAPRQQSDQALRRQDRRRSCALTVSSTRERTPSVA
jgi:hypothetical protein